MRGISIPSYYELSTDDASRKSDVANNTDDSDVAHYSDHADVADYSHYTDHADDSSLRWL